MEKGDTNWPNCAAPSTTIWVAPDEADSMMSRDAPSWPFGKTWISMAPAVCAFMSAATWFIMATSGWAAATTVAQRMTVAARARPVMANIETPASAARRVTRMVIGCFSPARNAPQCSRALAALFHRAWH